MKASSSKPAGKAKRGPKAVPTVFTFIALMFPLFLGGKSLIARLIVQFCIYTASAVFFLMLVFKKSSKSKKLRTGKSCRWLMAIGSLTVALVLLQVVPLPISTVESISPQMAAYYNAIETETAFLSAIPGASLSALFWFTALLLVIYWLCLIPPRQITDFVRVLNASGSSKAMPEALQKGRIDRTVNRLQQILIIAGVVCALLGLIHRAAGQEALFGFFDPKLRDLQQWEVYSSRVHWPFINPNHLAVLLVMSTMTLFGRLCRLIYLNSEFSAYISRRRSFWRFLRSPKGLLNYSLYLMLLLILLISCVLTLSRAGNIMLLLGLVIISISVMIYLSKLSKTYRASSPRFRSHSRSKSGGAYHYILMLLGFCLLLTYFFLNEGGRGLIFGRFFSLFESNLDIGRRMSFDASLKLLGDFYSTGVGFGCWHIVAAQYIPEELAGFQLDFAHNDLIQFISELGLFGALLLLGAISSICVFTSQALRREVNIGRKIQLISSFTVILLPVLHSAVEFPFHIPALAFLYCLALAVHLRLLRGVLQ